jgi:hypothetical protein
LSEDQYSGRGDEVTYDEGEVVDPQQGVSQRSPPKTSQRSPPVRRVSHPANTPLPKNTSPPVRSAPAAGPTNPYQQGTKKFLVAQRLIAGEIDKAKTAKDIGVSMNTIYNVISDLRSHGYVLSIDDGKTQKSTSPPSTSHSPAHQQSHPSEVAVRLTDDTHQESSSPSEVSGEARYDPGDIHQEEQAPPVSPPKGVNTMSLVICVYMGHS